VKGPHFLGTAMQPKCNWYQDGDETSELWQTGCNKYFCLNDGDPVDNKMKFCCYCGKSIVAYRLNEDGEHVLVTP
jgi:hypothetical protein